jgi:hypothetical protein
MTEPGVSQVVGMPFDEFLDWLTENFLPGQHMTIIAPTGEGKTTFAKPVLDLRKWVMALDPKGEDDTLEQYGYTRVREFPLPRKLRNDIADGKPARLVVGGSRRTDSEEAQLKALLHQAMREVRQQGGWTVYIDEFQIAADRRMFGLDKQAEQMLIAARRDKSSVITSYQAPAWVPKAALRQCRVAVIGATRDVNMIKAVAEAMGRDWKQLVTIVHELPKWTWCVLSRDVHAPVIITRPPKL